MDYNILTDLHSCFQLLKLLPQKNMLKSLNFLLLVHSRSEAGNVQDELRMPVTPESKETISDQQICMKRM